MKQLAPGIVVLDGGAVSVDPEIVYPTILDKVGAPALLDQYWIEVAYQCAKLEAQRLVRDAELWPAGGTLAIIVESRKGQDGGRSWALVDHPVGRGVAAATKGREAREHYRRWRGELPQAPAMSKPPEQPALTPATPAPRRRFGLF